MNQQNPIFDDNVNVSKTHPLRDLFWLAGGAILIVVTVTVFLYITMQWLAPHVPFAYEQKLATQIDLVSEEGEVELHAERMDYLQNLTNALAKAQNVNDDIDITVHWLEDDMVNAFATLGGHIFITKGLWESMPDENSLAMVLAHEIAHVNHRDPLKGTGAGVTFSLLSALIFGSSDAGSSLLSASGLLTSLHFSRSMETEADRAAIQTLYQHYGHVAGATRFFEDILNDEGFQLQFMQTHPLTRERIDKLIQIEKENKWPTEPELLVPIPFSVQ